ncbi:MAG: nucleotide pyrophosphohydrolase [Desulfobulbus propionicus]|nr:MAG: nucleotide pyrophosphohydrolase [Desulfobulbus propionicus]PIE60373.1 MAG: nucleotide pyrophosphohydrolase [Desulfobulbus propionicus]
MSAEQQFVELFRIIRTLRGEKGCPWDKKQTPESLKKYLVEECDELVEAITSKETTHVCEEIGDLFFVLSMLLVMYDEQKAFSPEVPLMAVCEKMIRRHPHVFGDATYQNEAQLHKQWEQIKKEEKLR